MRKMNRHFSILCTIILIFALTAPAYAAGTPEEGVLVGAEDLIPAYDGTAFADAFGVSFEDARAAWYDAL